MIDASAVAEDMANPTRFSAVRHPRTSSSVDTAMPRKAAADSVHPPRMMAWLRRGRYTEPTSGRDSRAATLKAATTGPMVACESRCDLR